MNQPLGRTLWNVAVIGLSVAGCVALLLRLHEFLQLILVVLIGILAIGLVVSKTLPARIIIEVAAISVAISIGYAFRKLEISLSGGYPGPPETPVEIARMSGFAVFLGGFSIFWCFDSRRTQQDEQDENS